MRQAVQALLTSMGISYRCLTPRPSEDSLAGVRFGPGGLFYLQVETKHTRFDEPHQPNILRWRLDHLSRLPEPHFVAATQQKSHHIHDGNDDNKVTHARCHSPKDFIFLGYKSTLYTPQPVLVRLRS